MLVALLGPYSIVPCVSAAAIVLPPPYGAGTVAGSASRAFQRPACGARRDGHVEERGESAGREHRRTRAVGDDPAFPHQRDAIDLGHDLREVVRREQQRDAVASQIA